MSIQVATFHGTEAEARELIMILMANAADELVHDQRFLDWALWLRRFPPRDRIEPEGETE